jgi:hypothetical protein
VLIITRTFTKINHDSYLILTFSTDYVSRFIQTIVNKKYPIIGYNVPKMVGLSCLSFYIVSTVP